MEEFLKLATIWLFTYALTRLALYLLQIHK